MHDLPENLSAVVISHSHYDHLDLQSCKDLNKRYTESEVLKVNYLSLL